MFSGQPLNRERIIIIVSISRRRCFGFLCVGSINISWGLVEVTRVLHTTYTPKTSIQNISECVHQWMFNRTYVKKRKSTIRSVHKWSYIACRSIWFRTKISKMQNKWDTSLITNRMMTRLTTQGSIILLISILVLEIQQNIR